MSESMKEAIHEPMSELPMQQGRAPAVARAAAGLLDYMALGVLLYALVMAVLLRQQIIFDVSNLNGFPCASGLTVSAWLTEFRLWSTGWRWALRNFGLATLALCLLCLAWLARAGLPWLSSKPAAGGSFAVGCGVLMSWLSRQGQPALLALGLGLAWALSGFLDMHLFGVLTAFARQPTEFLIFHGVAMLLLMTGFSLAEL